MNSGAQLPAVPSRELQFPWVTSRNFHGQFWLDGALGRKKQRDREQRRGAWSRSREEVRHPREKWAVSPALSRLCQC